MFFLNRNVWISPKITPKFAPKGPINNIQALVQIMAWRRSGDKPSSEPMVVRLLKHICVTRPQWVNNYENSMYVDVKLKLIHIQPLLPLFTKNKWSYCRISKKSRSRDIGCSHYCITLNFDMCLRSTAAETPAKFRNDRITPNPFLGDIWW